MRFRDSLVIVIALLATGVPAQDTWIRQSPLPADANYNGVSLLGPDHAFVCGSSHTLVETPDGGKTWFQWLTGPLGADPFYAVLFSDAEHGYVLGNGSDSWRSTDGGVHWSRMYGVPGGSWYQISFFSPLEGIIGANGAAAATYDGGVNWYLRSGYPDCPVMYGADYRDPLVGIAGGWLPKTDADGIFKTIDGGKTWDQTHPKSANTVLWMDSNRVIADEGTTVLESLDAGDSWHTIASGIWTGFSKITRAGTSDVVVGVSLKGDIWRSPDGGYSWDWVFDGLGSLPASWDVKFVDSDNGWVVGDTGLIFATSDSGITWRQINSGVGSQIYDLKAIDGNVAMAVAHNGYILRTENGGKFWKTQKVEVTGQIFGRDENLHAIDVLNRDVAIVAGPGGMVFRTDDGAQSWQNIGYPALSGDFYIEGVSFTDPLNGWIAGTDYDLGHEQGLFHTVDGGMSWEPVTFDGPAGWNGVQFVDSEYGWLYRIGGSGLRTIDGGQNWLEMGLAGGPTLSRMRFLDRQHGWAVGWYGYVAKTDNGGVSWQPLDLGSTEEIYFDVAIVSATDIWIVGRDTDFNGVMRHTTDGGKTWSRQMVNGYPYYPYRITAPTSNDMWFGGYNGAICHKEGPKAKLTGKVSLEFLSTTSGLTGVLALRQPGTQTSLYSFPITLGFQGSYSVQDIEPGTYDVAFKLPRSLRGVVSNRALVAGANQQNFALINGDVDGNNAVDLVDLNQILLEFGTDLDSDLNYDGVVDLFDFNIVLLNFGAVGG